MAEQIANRFSGCELCLCGSNRKSDDGVSDKEQNISLDDDTIFPACSMSKFVTAICLMKLHEENQMDIDAPEHRY